MWKESYKIGVESIDIQHQKLFVMVDGMLKAIKLNAEKEKFRQAVEFMKSYVVLHFKEEEAYQALIQYDGMEAHKKLHYEFTKTVLAYEKKLIESDYDMRVLKDLAGTLTSWLIYHVADADQKITAVKAVQGEQSKLSYIENFTAGLYDTLGKMAGLDQMMVKEENVNENSISGDIYVEIGIIGDREGSVIYGFSKELAFSLLKNMTSIEPTQIDEFVCSALAEISNIASGTAATRMVMNNIVCDIKPPCVSTMQRDIHTLECVKIDTGIGELQIGVIIDK